ncbi:hypothetical protein [Cellulosimicrobium marinum]|uniref:hypothetical protein n=1 Tax=Cellulosimicrobium marinum TaxID=1638992 RepID=UPI0027E1988E|nr:hypothetical protein [Cellulosimicrobium marinum]MCB7136941.1 hypothetical protein [Cellulosimicrobium marinum]
MRVSVVGCGRRGVLHAACLAAAGHDVVALEPDRAARRALRDGPLSTEPRLRRLLALALVSGRLRVTGDRTALAGSRVHVLCTGRGAPRACGDPAVDDPSGDATARARAMLVALEELAPHLGPGDLVVGRDRVPCGTADLLAAALASDGVRATVVWVPDEHRRGRAVLDTLRPARLLYGVPDGALGPRAVGILDALHDLQLAGGVPRTTTDLRTAEDARPVRDGRADAPFTDASPPFVRLGAA